MRVPVVIDNPILNSPFEEPGKHFQFGDEGITNDVVDGRRRSSYFIPIARPRSRSRQQKMFETEWTQDRIEENHFINRVRERVEIWRKGGYPGITPTTRRLLEYWREPDRERRLFFCQIEALETAIYLTEVADKLRRRTGSTTSLREANEELNPGCSTASPSRWRPAPARRSSWRCSSPGRRSTSSPTRRTPASRDAFLIVTPGITIRDRLRVLLPNDPSNYYRERDIVPPDMLERPAARRRSSSPTSTPSCCASARPPAG